MNFPGSPFDSWLVFNGNPQEQEPKPVGCPYCARTHHQEEDENICPRCIKAGVFRCAVCREWLPSRMLAMGTDDACAGCVHDQ